jgi:hypothetical protein
MPGALRESPASLLHALTLLNALTFSARNSLVGAMFTPIWLRCLWFALCAAPLPALAQTATTPSTPLQAGLVSTPRAQVLAVSATNRPFLAAGAALKPVNLAAAGYEESELLVSGFANIYEWGASAGELSVRVPGVAYTTRILVRRPRDPARFSGRVIVELLNPAGSHDFAPLWGFSWEYFTRRGDAWVGVTVNPVAAATLRRFDPVRYAQLSFAHRQSADCAPAASAAGATAAGQANPPDAETGLAWDVIAQVGALLRSSSKENPLLALNPHRVLVAGYSQAGGYITTYANALHSRLRLGDGHPVFDGYLNAAGAIAAPINQCAAALGAADPRRGALPRDVPFVTVMTESDFLTGLPQRRGDSDEPADVFRLYELAGAAHSGPFAAGQPATADLTIAGLAAAPEDLCREPRGDFPLGYAFNAIWQQYEELLLQKTPMSHEPVIETAQGKVMRDDSGNALGGWRLPQIDVPVAVWSGSSTARAADARSQQVCALTGAKQPLTAAALKTRYRNRAEYVRRFSAAVDSALQARRVTAEDAATMKATAASGVPPF